MTGYGPTKHHRHSIRLTGYDYGQAGTYFITVCTKNKISYFKRYPELKRIVQAKWESLRQQFPSVSLDAFITMPNHVHAIIILGIPSTTLAVGAALAAAHAPAAAQIGQARGLPLQEENSVTHKSAGETLMVAPQRAGASPAPTLGDVVGTFKSLCVTEWLRYIKLNSMDAVGSIWQRNYYEHVIRNEMELNRIREYIMYNPLKWGVDLENPDRAIDLGYVAEWKWLEGNPSS